MATFVKLTETDGHEIWINLDNVTALRGYTERTEVIMNPSGILAVAETPEHIAHLAVSESPLGVGR